MAAGHDKRISMRDEEVDKLLGDKAVRRHVARTPRVDRGWDIPYLGGYSENGKTIYIDRHLPWTSLDSFLVLHETIEKVLIDQLGLSYAHAHEIATREEERAVKSCGIDLAWYRATLKPFIKSDEKKPLLRVPADLDLTPYRAAPVDTDLLKRVEDAMRHPAPAGKIDPKEADYGPGRAMGDHCGICAYFQPPTGCTVLPRAKADMWCKYFTKRRASNGRNGRDTVQKHRVHRAS